MEQANEKKELIESKLEDAETPSFQVIVDPQEADELGAFEENALTESEALDSTIDIEE